MSNRDTCHGCEGKGWIMIVTVERTSPFFSRDRISPQPANSVMVTREFDTRDCPICKGEGTVNRRHATIGDAVKE